MRNFQIAANMLKALEISKIDLLSNNPKKYEQLKINGISVRRRINTGFYLKKENENYMKAKIKKSGHQFPKNIFTLAAS